MDDDDVLRGDFVESRAWPHAFAREVHIGLRFKKQHLLSGELRSIELALELIRRALGFPALDEAIDEQESGIVPGRLVLWARIAEANNEFHSSALIRCDPQKAAAPFCQMN